MKYEINVDLTTKHKPGRGQNQMKTVCVGIGHTRMNVDNTLEMNDCCSYSAKDSAYHLATSTTPVFQLICEICLSCLVLFKTY